MIEVRKIKDETGVVRLVEIELFGALTDLELQKLADIVVLCVSRNIELMCNGYMLVNIIGGTLYLGLNVLDRDITAYLLSELSKRMKG